MYFFVRFRTSGFENFPELYSSGKFSILAKFWNSFKSHAIVSKFHGDNEYVVSFDDSSVVEVLYYFRFTSGNFFRKVASELCSVCSSQYCKLDFKLKKLHL